MKEFLLSANAVIVFAALLILMSSTAALAVEVVGHRGAAFYAPENTVASFKKALEMGVDGVEIDVYLTKDKNIAVIHDKDTKRVSGGASMLKISESTREELKKVDAGSFKGEAFKGEKIPMLEEVLDIVPAGKKLFIEIKCGVEIFQSLVPMIKNSGRAETIVIISFSLDVAALAKLMLPRCESYWLLDANFFSSAKIEDAIKIAVSNKLDGLDINYKLASAEVIRKSRAAGLKFYVWTVDTPETALILKSCGLDGITTNKPDAIIDRVREKTAR